jgi:cytochrome c
MFNILSNKRKAVTHSNLTFDNCHLNAGTNPKHLGLIFSSDGSWINHMNYILEKASKRLNVLSKFKVDRKSLETIHFSYIRPILKYADIVWDNITKDMCEKLEKLI